MSASSDLQYAPAFRLILRLENAENLPAFADSSGVAVIMMCSRCSQVVLLMSAMGLSLFASDLVEVYTHDHPKFEEILRTLPGNLPVQFWDVLPYR